MAFNGTGTFLRIYNWVTDKVNGVPITASRFDTELDGMATGLSNCITKDGQTTIIANIPLNSNKLTGVGSGTARTDTINVGQVQDNQFQYLGTTGGGADVYTLAPSPAITVYTATQQFTAKISATNLTTTPYLQISSIASPATTAVIKKLSATKTEIAVAIGDLVANGIYTFKRNSANDAWIVLELSNRKTPTIQQFTSGSGTCTIANGVLYLGIKIVGGGGGGGGSGSGGGQGGAGGSTTFGASFLTCDGGVGGFSNGGTGSVGGGFTINAGANGTGLTGGYGGSGVTTNVSGSSPKGGDGGNSPFGGGGSGAGGSAGTTGTAGITNTGGGGGGAGGSATTTFGGAGGGAGGYINAIIANPSATYTYAIGAGGAGGTAGASGFTGGAGGSGYIEITEFYN